MLIYTSKQKKLIYLLKIKIMENWVPSQNQIKQTAKTNLKVQYWFTKAIQNIGIIAIEDEVTREFLVNWLSEIWLWAVVIWTDFNYDKMNVISLNKINSNNLVWFDFFIYDNNHNWVDVVKYMQSWIVPIMPDNNTYSWILNWFDPMKFEWNWFFWKKNSQFCIFEKVVSYLENIKFPEDRRILIKNVMKTF